MPQSSPNPFGDLPYQPAGQEEVVKAKLVPEGKADPGERISILYLMAWTACTAVILAFYRQSLSMPASPTNPMWIRVAIALISSPVQGVCVASLLLVLWRKVRGGRPFPRHPGHWLLVVPGVTYVVSWPLIQLVRLASDASISNFILFYRLPLLIVVCISTVFAIVHLRAERRWRVMFIIWLLTYVVSTLFVCSQAGMYAMSVVEPALGIVAGLGFLVPTLADAAGGVRRDPLHYAGVAGRLVNAGLMAIYLLRVWLLQ